MGKTEIRSMTYDQFLEALCLWREARGQSAACQAAILAVIRNRAADPHNRWPKTSAGVVTQPWQFSSFNASDPNVTKWPTPHNALEWSIWQQCCNIAETPLTADPTSGATNYESLPDGMAKPGWADEAKLTLTLGPFRFYKL